MRLRLIAPESQPLLPWRNGAGSTREICRIGPEQAFCWRASVARCDAEGPFSAFPGFQRHSCLLDGGPLTLSFPDRELLLAPRLRAYSYPGTPAPYARLHAEFATLFNLIVSEQIAQAQLLPRPLVGSMVFFDHPHTDWLIYLTSGEGELRLGEHRLWLGAQHAVVLEGEAGTVRAVLDGGGEVVLAKIVRSEPQST